jgi:hypothetical protein
MSLTPVILSSITADRRNGEKDLAGFDGLAGVDRRSTRSMIRHRFMIDENLRGLARSRGAVVKNKIAMMKTP